MSRSRRIALVAAWVGVLLSPSARAAVLSYTATLTGPGESPANTSPGTGTALVDVDTVANTMHVHVTFSGLTGTTSASHIHAPTAAPLTGTAGVATTTPTFANFPLGVTSGTYDNTLDLTQSSSYNPAYVSANGGTPASAENALLSAIAAQESYLNIHTSTFPGGEIRGFLVAVPEPASIGLLGGAVTWFALRRSRRVA
jgi:hypothetical protein